MPIAFYLYYCSWLFDVLHTFQQIRAELTATSPQLSPRFDPIREEYNQLLEVLQEELQSIGTMLKVDETTAAQVRAEVEAVGKELTQDWHRAVVDIAKEIQGEQ